MMEKNASNLIPLESIFKVYKLLSTALKCFSFFENFENKTIFSKMSLVLLIHCVAFPRKREKKEMGRGEGIRELESVQ